MLTKRRVFGLVNIALGVFVLFSPVIIGEWIISLLGLVLIVAGLFQIVQTLRTTDPTSSWLSYFNAIHEIMRRHQVDIAMAGDTHDFEFYREKYVLSRCRVFLISITRHSFRASWKSKLSAHSIE